MELANPPATGKPELDQWLTELVSRLRHMRPIEGDYIELPEITAPGAPGSNRVRIYAVDNGSAKTQLMAIFPTGAAQELEIEP